MVAEVESHHARREELGKLSENILMRLRRNFSLFFPEHHLETEMRGTNYEKPFREAIVLNLNSSVTRRNQLKKYLLSEDAPVGVVYVELPVEPVYLLGAVRGVVHQPGPVLGAQQALLGSRALTHEQACHTASHIDVSIEELYNNHLQKKLFMFI